MSSAWRSENFHFAIIFCFASAGSSDARISLMMSSMRT